MEDPRGTRLCTMYSATNGFRQTNRVPELFQLPGRVLPGRGQQCFWLDGLTLAQS